jgi:hypothetical protein
MRTTLTLDPDVVRLIEEEVHRRRQSFKQVINDAIRRALSPRPATTEPASYSLVPHHARLQPGLDPGALNRLVDELEVVAAVDKARSK